MRQEHEGERQVLAGRVFTGREEIKAVIWPPGYLWGGRGGVVQATCIGVCTEQGRAFLTPAGLKMKISGFGHVSTSLLL